MKQEPIPTTKEQEDCSQARLRLLLPWALKSKVNVSQVLRTVSAPVDPKSPHKG